MEEETNYRAYAARVAPRKPFGGRLGRVLIGSIALAFDSIAEGVRQAARASWIGDVGSGPAPDALGPGGREVSMPRYPGETEAQYSARLERAWQDWPFAGTEGTLLAQLAAAGFPGAQIRTPHEWPTRAPADYWSQFWVFFAIGTHTVTSAGPPIGTFTIGDGTIIGPVGITPQQIFTLRRIIRKWKPGHWICRGIVFEVSGWTIGDGSLIGDPDLVIGGLQVEIGA